MKLFFVTCSFLAMSALTTFAGRVEHVYHFGSPLVTQTGQYQRFELKNTMLTALPGQPVLPYQKVKLMLPPGESAVSVEILFSDEILFPDKLNIFPQQQVRPISAGSSGVFIKDNALYNRNASLPDDPKGKLITSFINGRSFALTTFTPVRYNPVTGKLSYYSAARVIIHTAPDNIAAKALDNLGNKNAEALHLADNKELAKVYSDKRQAPLVTYDYLIISTSEFKNSFTKFQSDYLKQGIASRVVTLDSINETMTGIDVPEKIRNFIIQEYQSYEIKYVLLAGDAELIPYRGLFCYVQSGSGYTNNNIPSDLYYSALDGNWNTDGDALWGESGEEDLLPDVAVGRMPFSNASELDHMLNKSYKYQYTPVSGEFRNILMAGENLWTVAPYITWGSDYLDLLKGEHSDNGYTTTGIPVDYPFDDMFDETHPWTGQDLMNHLNLGRPMLNHVGHSSQTYVMKLNNGDVTNDNFSSLNGIDHNFTIVYTHGCDCGAFDYSDCIAEKMVTIDNFAAAFIGNSRYGWFNEGQTEGPSPHLHREFIDALYSDSLNRIGRAHMESKIASAAWVTAPGQWEPGALRWVFYDCNLLGDPAMAVYTDNPVTINTTFPAAVALGSNSMSVNVMSQVMPAPGLTCVVMKDGNLIGKSLTDESGNAIVNFDILPLNSGNAWLIVSGYNCVPVSYEFKVVDYTGVDELTANHLVMSIAPNPAKDMISVNAFLKTKCIYTLNVFNNTGKILIASMDNETDSKGQLTKILDISTLKPGYYLCEITTGNSRISKSFVAF